MASDSKFSKDDAYQTLELINSWINNVDTKVSFALAYVVVLIGFVFYNAGTVPVAIQSFLDANKKYDDIILGAFLVVSLYGSSLISIIMFFIAMLGRTKNSSDRASVLFFGAIASMKLNDYKSKIMNMNDKDIEKDLLEQIHTNSTICVKKFRFYNLGICFLITATVLCFVCMVFQLI